MPIGTPAGNLDIKNATLRTSNLETQNIKIGSIFVGTGNSLEETANVGNSMSNTIQFTNTHTAFTTTGNVSVGKDLTVTGNVTASTFSDGTAQLTGGTWSGSAASLTTAVDIGGVAFDGTASIVPTTFGAATFSGDVTVDTNTLHVDATNNRIGVGTTTPGQKLSIYTGSTSTAALSFDRYSTDNYRTDIYQNSYGPDFRVGYGSHTPESILYLKRLSGGGKEIEMDGTLTGSAINGLTRNFSFFDNLGSDGAWRTAFTVGTTAIGLFSVVSYSAGNSQSNALWYYQYKSGGTSGGVVRITGSSSPNFRFVSSSRTIEHNNGGSGTHFTQLRVFPFEI